MMSKHCFVKLHRCPVLGSAGLMSFTDTQTNLTRFLSRAVGTRVSSHSVCNNQSEQSQSQLLKLVHVRLGRSSCTPFIPRLFGSCGVPGLQYTSHGMRTYSKTRTQPSRFAHSESGATSVDLTVRKQEPDTDADISANEVEQQRDVNKEFCAKPYMTEQIPSDNIEITSDGEREQRACDVSLVESHFESSVTDQSNPARLKKEVEEVESHIFKMTKIAVDLDDDEKAKLTSVVEKTLLQMRKLMQKAKENEEKSEEGSNRESMFSKVSKEFSDTPSQGAIDAALATVNAPVQHPGLLEPKTGHYLDVRSCISNLAPLVRKVEILSALVFLGVNISKLQKLEAANKIIRLNFETDVKPLLFCFHDLGIPQTEVGQMLTKCPFVLLEDIEDIKVRINYLESKRFRRKDIAAMVTRNPKLLVMTATRLDAKLMFYQRMFKLTGDQVRSVAIGCPRLVTLNEMDFKENLFCLKENCGFSDDQIKTMFLTVPALLTKDRHAIGKRFDYLHSVMGLSHDALMQWPRVLKMRQHKLEQRHRFLLSIGRVQYDPTREKYISLKDLSLGMDMNWCHTVANATWVEYENFLKMI